MAQMPIPVDEIVGLLATYDPKQLTSLRQAFPEQPELFRPGIQAGPQDSSLRIKAQIALAGMNTTARLGDEHLSRLRSRMTRSRSLKLTAQIFTVLASSAVLALLKSEVPSVDRYIAAVIGVITAVLSLLSDSLAKSRVSGVSLEHAYQTLVKEQVTAEQIADELSYLIQAEQWNRVETLVRRSNVCSAAIKIALRTT